MQAIEVSTTISSQGQIDLPANLHEIYGRRARLIVLIEDSPPAVTNDTDTARRREILRRAMSAVAEAGIFRGVELKEGEEIELHGVGDRTLEVARKARPQALLARLRRLRGRLPVDFRFDRLEANEEDRNP
jgi:antitoxin MazE